MNKTELTSELFLIVKQKTEECEGALARLDASSKTERAALRIQKNLYGIATAGVQYCGNGAEFPEIFLRRLDNMLSGEDGLRDAIEKADAEDKCAIQAYIGTMLFLRNNLLMQSEKELEKSSPEIRVKANLKCRVLRDLMDAFRRCFERMGGREDLAI